jgi:hypothetical protein
MREWRYSSTITNLGRFTPEKTALHTHCIGSWVDPTAVWKLWRGEKYFPVPGFAPRFLGRPARSLVSVRSFIKF